MASRSRAVPKSDVIRQIATRSLDKARAWRFVLVTRLMGVRPMDDQASDTMRDVLDALITIRCELNAIHGALVDAKVLVPDDVIRRIGEAAEEINVTYETMFPGLWVDDEGSLHYDEKRMEPSGKAPN